MKGHMGRCKDEATGYGKLVINLGSRAEVYLQNCCELCCCTANQVQRIKHAVSRLVPACS